MTAALLLATAALLVAFGGLMAAVDAALGVTSRSDLEEMSQSGRNAAFLRGISVWHLHEFPNDPQVCHRLLGPNSEAILEHQMGRY